MSFDGRAPSSDESRSLEQEEPRNKFSELSQPASRHSTQVSPVPDPIDETYAPHDAYSSELEEKYCHFVGPSKPLPPCPGDESDYLITWISEDDAGKPVNWPFIKKSWILCLCALFALSTVFGSAVIGPGTSQIKQHFHVGLPVATLNVSLFVLGFALGPMLWGPASEILGRQIPVLVGVLGLTLFAYACASAANFQTLVLSRFFAGVFGSATITVTLAVMSDMFNNEQRGRAVSIVSLMIFAGPMLAPVIGGYIAASFLGWRWTQYIWGILASLSLALSLFLPETYPPKILATRASKIRKITGNWSVGAPLEKSELDGSELLNRTLLKPFRMLAIEPILLLISLYHGFIYGILYLCLEAVPIIFGDYGWHGGNIYLPYLGMMVGAILATATMVFIFEPSFLKKLEASPYPVIPEERLPLMMFCGICFSAGIFLMCWSGAYRVMWFVPTLGCAIIGYGLVGIFLAALNYIIDSYVGLAASALAANTFMRSSFGCAFPLFVHPMFINLGTQWAGTLLGCLAALLAPIPFLFYFFGAKIRAKSKYAANFEALERELSRYSTNPTGA